MNDKISIKGDIEAFDNRISKSDSYQWYDKSSRQAYQPGETSQANSQYVDQYSLFTINKFYVDALTGVGKFIVGKTRKFNGIGWFIQLPDVPGWTFGLVWNKLNEGANPDSYYGYTGRTATSTPFDGNDNLGVVTNHDNADEDDYALVFNYAKDAIDFKGTLAYKMTGHSNVRTSIWVPYFYLNYAVSNNVTFNSKLGIGTGTLIDKESPVAKTGVDTAGTLVGTEVNTASGGLVPAATAKAAFLANFPNGGMMKDWEVDNAFQVWLGAGVSVEALKIQGDVMYLKGAEKPQNISAYSEDDENLDTWLMNDIADLYSVAIQTPGTIKALLPGGKRDTTGLNAKGTLWDGAFSFANAILVRLNLAYKFTDKLDGNLNLVWAKMENTDYLENWNTIGYGDLNAIAPNALKVGGPLASPSFLPLGLISLHRLRSSMWTPIWVGKHVSDSTMQCRITSA